MVRLNKGMFTSNSNEWQTPSDLFQDLDEEFEFTLDPCCTKETAKCAKFFTIQDDGLKQDWSKDVVFMNPPYGKEIKDWIKKAFKEAKKGATVVCLIPARTDTKYWHDYCFKGEVRFLKGRLKFSNAGSAPFPSAVVIFDKYRLIAKKEERLMERVKDLIPECESLEQVMHAIQVEIDFHKLSTGVFCGSGYISLPDNMSSDEFEEIVGDLWNEYWSEYS